jgi:hypothetical protein
MFSKFPGLTSARGAKRVNVRDHMTLDLDQSWTFPHMPQRRLPERVDQTDNFRSQGPVRPCPLCPVLSLRRALSCEPSAALPPLRAGTGDVK